jgi:RNA polymerase sigma-70 factor (ECF subfamily)
MERAVNQTSATLGPLSRASEPPASGEVLAWGEIVRTVHAHMRSIVGPTRDLEDLTQAALEQVVRGLPRFEGRSQWTTFTYRICVHVAMNHWRWYKRWLRRFRVGVDDVPELQTPREDEPPALSVERERARRLHAALERLAPAKRLVITLADFEGLTASRIGKILGCPEPTVRSRLRQARLTLAALLDADPFFAQISEEER